MTLSLLLIAASVSSVTVDPECRSPKGSEAELLCAGNDQIDADNELNRIWPKVLKAVEGLQDGNSHNLHGDLVKAQRAWLAYRDATCQLTFDSESTGSFHHAEADQATCLARVTRARIAELKTDWGL